MYDTQNTPTFAPLDQRLARRLVRPLVHAPVHPNALTTLTLILGVMAAICFSRGTPAAANTGAIAFMLAVFSDHLDGELARLSGKTSRFGHYYDFVVGGVIYMLLFASIGYGFAPQFGNDWLMLGIGAALCNPAILLLRIRLDGAFGLAASAHPRVGYFNLEDFIYAIGPLVWLCGIEYFFIPFAAGTVGYLVWTIAQCHHWFHPPVR